MNRYALLLLLLCTWFTSSSQEVKNDQWTMFSKKTAEWCPKCGDWGWEMMEGVVNALENDNVIIWGLHYSGDLKNTASQDISSNFGGSGQPIFYVNNTDINVLSFNVPDKITEAIGAIETLNEANATVGVVINTSFNEQDELEISGKIKFFEAAEGEYYLGLYEIQDHFIYSQAGYGPDADHRKLLKRALNGSTFGELIISDNVSANQEFDINVTSVDFDMNDLVNKEVVAVIWKKSNDNKYIFQNGSLDRNVGTTSSINQVAIEPLLNVYYKAMNHSLSVEIQDLNLDAEYDILVMDTNGKIVSKKDLEFSLPDQERFEVSLPSLSNGLYLVSLLSDHMVFSSKVFIYR